MVAKRRVKPQATGVAVGAIPVIELVVVGIVVLGEVAAAAYKLTALSSKHLAGVLQVSLVFGVVTVLGVKVYV